MYIFPIFTPFFFKILLYFSQIDYEILKVLNKIWFSTPVCNGSTVTCMEKATYILVSFITLYSKAFVIQISFSYAKIQVILKKEIRKFIAYSSGTTKYKWSTDAKHFCFLCVEISLLCEKSEINACLMHIKEYMWESLIQT